MPYRNAVLTSPTHAIALGIYLFIAFMGFAQLADFARTEALAQYFGSAGTVLWAAGMLCGGSGAFIASVNLGRKRDRWRYWLAVEAGSQVLISASFAVYAYSIFAFYQFWHPGACGPSPTVGCHVINTFMTRALALAVSVSAFYRFVQIVREHGRVISDHR